MKQKMRRDERVKIRGMSVRVLSRGGERGDRFLFGSNNYEETAE